MTSKSLMDMASTSAVVSTADLKALSRLIAAEVFAGLEQLRDEYESRDYQGALPPRYAALDVAYAENERRQQEAAHLLASGPAYAALVAEHGLEAVAYQVYGWSYGPAEAAARLAKVAACRAGMAEDAAAGKAGSLLDLAKLYPQHVRAEAWYSEAGDGGWAGAGPDSWGSGIDYRGLTPAGLAAIEAVRAGARPVPAMTAAVAADTVRLEAEGRERAEAAALANADRAEAARLQRARQEIEYAVCVAADAARHEAARSAKAMADARDHAARLLAEPADRNTWAQMSRSYKALTDEARAYVRRVEDECLPRWQAHQQWHDTPRAEAERRATQSGRTVSGRDNLGAGAFAALDGLEL